MTVALGEPPYANNPGPLLAQSGHHSRRTDCRLLGI